jgi:hypothetical protein
MLKRLEFAEHCRDEFRNGRVNVHGPLNDRIRRSGIHHVKDRVNGLVAILPRLAAPRISMSLGIDDDFHNPCVSPYSTARPTFVIGPPANQRAAAAFANFFECVEQASACVGLQPANFD